MSYSLLLKVTRFILLMERYDVFKINKHIAICCRLFSRCERNPPVLHLVFILTQRTRNLDSIVFDQYIRTCAPIRL